MTDSFAYSPEWLEKRGAIHTANEIDQQPSLWSSLYHLLKKQYGAHHEFLQPLLSDPNISIILTGAGSSDFVGKALAPWLREKTQRDVQSYGTTDIVTTPLQCFNPNKKTLMVSFARSGNSPESVAAVKLADKLIPDCYHLMLTCNPHGELADYARNKSNAYSVLMPAESNDKGFAMTSSFSCMALTAIILLSGEHPENYQVSIDEVVALCEKLKSDWREKIRSIANQHYSRVVYTGSGCFKGLAEECSLKMLELTAGAITTRHDSTLGFRHGPKFIINSDSLTICFLSNRDYVRQYDLDLFNEIQSNQIAKKSLALSGRASDKHNIISINSELEDIWLIFPYLLFGQILAFESSLAVGLNPDNPCPTGEVNRVVQGVTIYPFTDK